MQIKEHNDWIILELSFDEVDTLIESRKGWYRLLDPNGRVAVNLSPLEITIAQLEKVRDEIKNRLLFEKKVHDEKGINKTGADRATATGKESDKTEDCLAQDRGKE